MSPVQPGYGGNVDGPNPSLAPLAKGPFYAMRVLPGSFGTFAGLKTDPQPRVLGADGTPSPGSRSPARPGERDGRALPSGGINIGPAMTFGYIAGRHAAGVTEYENLTPIPLNDGN